MRAIAMMVLAAGLLLGGSPASAGSVTADPHVTLVQDKAPASGPGADCNCDQRPISSADLAVRLIYAALGAGAGYMYATNPVATTAVAAAFAGGVVTMWVYSTYYAKPGEAPVN